MEKFSLALGDWGSDGHGHSREYIINSNKPQIDIENAYKAAIKKMGFDVLNLCEDYEDNVIPADQWKSIVAAGFDPENRVNGYGLYNETEDSGEQYMDPDGFMVLILWFIQTGDNELQLSPENKVSPPNLLKRLNYGHDAKLIGYGVFGS